MEQTEQDRRFAENIYLFCFSIREEIGILHGYISMLRDSQLEEQFTKEDRQEFYFFLEHATTELRNITTDLYELSLIQAGKKKRFQAVNLRTIAEEVLASIQERPISQDWQPEYELILDFQPEHIVVDSNPDLLQIILRRLVAPGVWKPIWNRSDRSEVRITGRLEPEGEAALIGALDPAEDILDTGNLKAGRRQLRSCGGFYVIDPLVEAIQATIWEEIEKGKGSTFWLRIPVKQAGAKE